MLKTVSQNHSISEDLIVENMDNKLLILSNFNTILL